MGLLDFLKGKSKCVSCKGKPDFRCTLCSRNYCEPCIRKALEVWQRTMAKSDRTEGGPLAVLDGQGRALCPACFVRHRALAGTGNVSTSELQRSCEPIE